MNRGFRLLGWLLAASTAPIAARAEIPAIAEPGARTIDASTAVRLALQNNPSLRAAELDLERSRQNVVIEEGRYPFVYSANAGYRRSVIPRLGPDDSVSASVSRSYTVGTGLRRTFPFGTTAEVRLEGERFESDPLAGTFSGRAIGAGYGVTARASITQPLLRGFGTTVGELELRAAEANQVLSERSTERVTSELVRDVLMAYWELWYASQSVGIEAAARELAVRQADEARQKVAQGAAAPVDVLSFETRVAQLEEAVLAAETLRRQRSLELAQLVGSQATVLAATEPPPAIDAAPTEAMLAAALRAGSIELAELEEQVRVAQLRAEIAGDATRPRLDVDGFVESQGVSDEIPNAARRAAGAQWITAFAGLTFELPLNDSRSRAEREAALLNVRIAQQNLQAARNRIATVARLAIAQRAAAERQLELAQQTLRAAEQSHAAERERFELGTAVPIQVQQAEDELRRARLRVARARVDAAQAEAQVLHLAGSLRTRHGA